MLRPVGNFVKQSYVGIYGECRSAVSTIRTKGPGQMTFWLLALVIGVAAGAAALGFRVAISEIQGLLYGADDHTLATTLGSLDWKWVVGIPILGGLAVGLILSAFTPDGQARAVSDVIDAPLNHSPSFDHNLLTNRSQSDHKSPANNDHLCRSNRREF